MSLLRKIKLARARSLATRLEPGELTVAEWARRWDCSTASASRNLEIAVGLGLAARRMVKIVTPQRLTRRCLVYREKKG